MVTGTTGQEPAVFTHSFISISSSLPVLTWPLLESRTWKSVSNLQVLVAAAGPRRLSFETCQSSLRKTTSMCSSFQSLIFCCECGERQGRGIASPLGLRGRAWSSRDLRLSAELPVRAAGFPGVTSGGRGARDLTVLCRCGSPE